jgi:hypothetical protein
MLKGYRTYVVAVVLATIGFLAEMSAADWTKLLDDPKGGIGLIVGGVLMAVMRAITTTPPGKSDGAPDGQ